MGNQRVAAGALAALLTVAPIQDAFAASRAGGRVGGRVSSTRVAPAPRAPAPSASSTMAPRTTNIYVAPPPVVTSPFGGGYGYGYGYNPGFTGLSIGLSLADSIIREQQRQAFLQQQLRQQQELGRDQAMIMDLQRQLSEQNLKIEQLKAQQQ